jgi:hypothetical protein
VEVVTVMQVEQVGVLISSVCDGVGGCGGGDGDAGGVGGCVNQLGVRWSGRVWRW